MDGTLTRPALIALRCRTSDRTSGAGRGVEALADLLGHRLATTPRVIGSPGQPRSGRHEDDLVESRGCLLEAGGQVDDALAAGEVPVLLAGDCSICLTTLPTVARRRPEAKVLWLDAHGDFNTPQTTSSSFLGGMCLAGACGMWESGFEGAIDPRQVVLCGIRDLEAGEREVLERSGATVIGSELETLVYLQNALDGAPTYIHLDLDVLDPEVFPAQFPAPGGFPPEKLYDLLEAVAGSCEVVGVEITAFEAPADEEERCALAELVATTIAPLFAPEERDGVG